jgi:zinc protease
VKDELHALRDRPVAAADLDEAKGYLRGLHLLAQERSADLAVRLAKGEVLGSYESPDASLARIMAVTTEDVQRVARAYLDPERLTLVVLRP